MPLHSVPAAEIGGPWVTGRFTERPAVLTSRVTFRALGAAVFAFAGVFYRVRFMDQGSALRAARDGLVMAVVIAAVVVSFTAGEYAVRRWRLEHRDGSSRS